MEKKAVRKRVGRKRLIGDRGATVEENKGKGGRRAETKDQGMKGFGRLDKFKSRGKGGRESRGKGGKQSRSKILGNERVG
jgi:hypothetical protein